MSRLRITRDRMVIMFGWNWRQHNNWNSNWLMRMMNRHSYWLVRMVKSSWMMVNHMVMMTMHLVVFLVDSMVSPMVSYTMADMMSGGGDGDMVMSGGCRGGAMVMRVGWSCAKWREERQV